MRTRRIILVVLAIADVLARLVLGLPAAFGVMGAVAIIGVPICLAFMVADAVPWQRDQFVASAAGLVGLPVALLIPSLGWLATVAVVIAQVLAWASATPPARAPRS